VFKNLHDSVDAIPPTLISVAEGLRMAAPELFEKTLVHGFERLGLNSFQQMPQNL
jgi:hypothetical protein